MHDPSNLNAKHKIGSPFPSHPRLPLQLPNNLRRLRLAHPAMAAIYPVCFPVAFSSPVVHVSGSWIGSPAFPPSGFLVSAFLSSSILEEASDLFMVEGSTGAFLEEARVERKAFCLDVGGSEPVVHWEGLSSWDVIFFLPLDWWTFVSERYLG